MAIDKKVWIYGLGAVGAYLILKRSAATTPTSALGALGTRLGLGPGGAPTGTQLATRFGTAVLPQRPGLSAVPTTTGQQILQAGTGVGAIATGLGNLLKNLGIGTGTGTAPSQKPGQTPGSGGLPAGAPTSQSVGGAKAAAQGGVPCAYLDVSGNCTSDPTAAVFDTNGNPLPGGINPNAPYGFDNSGTPLAQGPTVDQTIVGLDASGNPTSDPSQAVYDTSGTGYSSYVVGLDSSGAPTTDPSQVAFDTSGNPVDEWTLPSEQTVPLDTTMPIVTPDVSSSLDTSGSL